MRNIVLIGDSLACPRPWIGLGHDDTYAALIQRALGNKAHVINLAHGERNTRHYASEAFTKTYIERSNTDTLIIQLGIVDCAPRLMTLAERGIGFLCKKTRTTNAIFMKYIAFKSRHRLFFTKYFPNVAVKLDEFERNINNIISAYINLGKARHIVLINIAYPGLHLTNRSFNVLNIIETYNDILQRAASAAPDRVQILDLFSITRDDQSLITPEDGHHITATAHEIIAKLLIDKIEA